MNSGADKKWIDLGQAAVELPPMVSAQPLELGPKEIATFPHAAIEQAMGHQVGTQVERGYRRTDVLDKRRQLMDIWGQYCEPEFASNVFQLIRANS